MTLQLQYVVFAVIHSAIGSLESNMISRRLSCIMTFETWVNLNFCLNASDSAAEHISDASVEYITAALLPVINIYLEGNLSPLCPHCYLDLLPLFLYPPPPTTTTFSLSLLLHLPRSDFHFLHFLVSKILWLHAVMNVCQRTQQLRSPFCPPSSPFTTSTAPHFPLVSPPSPSSGQPFVFTFFPIEQSSKDNVSIYILHFFFVFIQLLMNARLLDLQFIV